jgi:DeoR family fructose operon transcriptional repressor
MRERQRKIVEFVEKSGIASLADLAQLHGVSEFTIRRDIEYLAQSRLLAKIKGGAQRIETPSQFREAKLPSRLQINLTQKQAIANKAIEFIHSGETIFIDGSSTTICLARAMVKSCHGVTVVTNSILIALELSEASDITLIGMGGVFDKETFSYVGFDTNTPNQETFYVDKAFFSCAGFDPKLGTFENTAFNCTIKRQMAQQADKVFLLMDASKFNRHALIRVLNPEQINTLITEKADPPQIREQLAQQNIILICPD